MADAFLAIAATRAQDAELLALIAPRLTYDSRCWRIEWREGAGRCLVASHAIAAGTLIFTERPVVVASGGSAAVARGILGLSRESDEFKSVLQLQARNDDSERGSEKWALGIATINVHGAGGTFLDPSKDRRGVLGLLSSMMQHECAPSAVTHISSVADGSQVSLRTIRALAPGEAVSISYVGSYQPRATRQELLRLQHAFVCACARCTTLPETVRAFQCPNCGDGVCSPTSAAHECRELACDGCEAIMMLDDEMWSSYEHAERAEDVSECMQLLHPYHHRMVKMYQLNLLKLSGAQRAQVTMQHADARERMYAGFAHPSLAPALVANDVESAAVALLDAGDLAAAAAAFADAGQRFATFYGDASADAHRCFKAAAARSLAEYQAIQGEVHAHH